MNTNVCLILLQGGSQALSLTRAGFTLHRYSNRFFSPHSAQDVYESYVVRLQESDVRNISIRSFDFRSQHIIYRLPSGYRHHQYTRFAAQRVGPSMKLPVFLRRKEGTVSIVQSDASLKYMPMQLSIHSALTHTGIPPPNSPSSLSFLNTLLPVLTSSTHRLPTSLSSEGGGGASADG